MGEEDKEAPEPKSVKDYFQDAQRFDLTLFQIRHGRGFLLRSKYHRELEPIEELRKTKTGGESKSAGRIVPLPRPDFAVFPVRKRNPSSRTEFISVGRLQKNDVVIPDATLTAIQAFFKEDEQGCFFLLDAGSKNGTFINDRQAPAWGNGEPVAVEPGARVRFGSVEFTFLPVEEFYNLARSLQTL